MSRIKIAKSGAEANEQDHELSLGSIIASDSGAGWDDTRGGWLDPQLVTAARTEEMSYVRKRRVYARVPISQCWAETGKGPVGTGWVDTNTGADEDPTVRSRWVAKEFKIDERPGLFAPTPPLEGVKLVVSNCQQTWSSEAR
jgi:hypothetical protein